MINTQPKALIFADWLEGSKDTINKEAAKELRRLHEVNAELFEALKEVVAYCEEHGHSWSVMAKAKATIAKAGE